ncbi:histidine phosphatase family protein [Xenophilus arseniciresistens]|uniref:Histidine phosphatase family protein n=1 Tax=Xenophilus arseniciresistens TaxID=1283306 RepID=A0AAE3N500_9BURK|nr:histidine phosphatase family protein [Xenophilus arseniciresistens]MDA7415965.1 histidine phosphatase family protein [Xenophilus arseniciresistens]
MGKIVLVRHAQASLLSADYDQLSPLGEEQSIVLGRWWAARGEHFQHAFSGELRRQSRTAELSLAQLPQPAPALQIDARFNEYGHHDVFAAGANPELVDGEKLAALLRTAENPRRLFQQLFSQALESWVRGEGVVAGSLTWAGFRARCMDALMQVAEQCGSGQSAVIYSSGGAIAAMCQAIMGLPDEHVPALHYAVHNTSISRLLSRPGAVTLSSFNALPHLEAPGVPESLITYR